MMPLVILNLTILQVFLSFDAIVMSSKSQGKNNDLSAMLLSCIHKGKQLKKMPNISQSKNNDPSAMLLSSIHKGKQIAKKTENLTTNRLSLSQSVLSFDNHVYPYSVICLLQLHQLCFFNVLGGVVTWRTFQEKFKNTLSKLLNYDKRNLTIFYDNVNKESKCRSK